MIEIEVGPEGFTLSAGGRRVLSHSRRSPCVEIGCSENLARQNRAGCFKLRRRRASTIPLRSYKVLERSEDLAVVDFDGKLCMAARWKDGCLRLSFSRFDSSVNLFRLRLAASPDERIFGCGERSDKLDLKGRRLSLWVRDARREGGGSSYPLPAFLSTKDYWCAIDLSAYCRIDFRRASTVLDAWAVPREVVMGWGADAPAAAAGLGCFLGAPPAQPDWSFDGAWVEARGGIDETRRALEAALAAGVKVAALWSRDWCGAAPTGGPRGMLRCRFDDGLYPGLPAYIAALRAVGTRFIGYVSPLLDLEGELYAEASARGFCVKDVEGGDYLLATRLSPCAMLDLTHPEAVLWIKDILRREMLGIGMAGWLADSGEFLPADAVLASGESAAEVHNRWPLLWTKASREAMAESYLGAEAMLLARSGWLGSCRMVNAFCSGERPASFSRRDGLPAALPSALSVGLSGGGFWHSAAGTQQPEHAHGRGAECLARWAEHSAFSPLLLVGDVRGPEPAAASSPARAHLARMSGIYAALKPYHLAVADEVSRGLPSIRHPWLYYESDPEAGELSYQYLYGRDLMVAPALSSGAASRSSPLTELYLPEDEWIHLWTSRTFRGGRVAVEAPLGYPAVFYRAASSFAPLFDAIRRTARRM